MKLVDSHCHLDDASFAADRAEVVARARAAGVQRILMIGEETAGVHPHEASRFNPEMADQFREALRRPEILAVGEIGLDYHYNFSPPEMQCAVFIEHLRLASECGKPVIIHTREAWEDTVTLLRRHYQGPGVFHCFSEGPDEAAQVLDMGFHVAFGGILTFPNAGKIREAARRVPLDKLLVETDAPYLAPVPHRGKRNEPAYLVETARRLAQIRGESLEEVAAATTATFERLFAPLRT